MPGDFTAFVAEARLTYRVFREMCTTDLLALQAALETSMVDASTPEGIMFGAGQLALIAWVLLDRGIEPILAAPVPPSITCPVCGRTSYNPNDIAQRYCGSCHRFLDVPDYWKADPMR